MKVVPISYLKNSYKLSGLSEDSQTDYKTIFYEKVNQELTSAALSHKDSIKLISVNYEVVVGTEKVALTKDWFNQFVKDYQASYKVDLDPTSDEGSYTVTISGWS